jgi:adenylate cyclase
MEAGPSPRVERKLTTILAADAVGYSRAMAADEEAALGALRAARAVFARLIERHRGRMFSTAGDALMAEFPSVVEAVQCAVEVQRELDGRGSSPGTTAFRIGVHLGDVMVDGDDLFGDGVNLASRLEGLADPGGILISQPVYDQVHAKLGIAFDYLGEQRPKNLAADVPIYRVALSGGRMGRRRPSGPDPEARTAPLLTPPADDRWGVLRRRSFVTGALWLGLVAVDLLTGPGFWAHWPGIALLAGLGLWFAPLVACSHLGKRTIRLAVVVAALALVNLATWTGDPWVVWPALAIAVFEVIRRLNAR